MRAHRHLRESLNRLPRPALYQHWIVSPVSLLTEVFIWGRMRLRRPFFTINVPSGDFVERLTSACHLSRRRTDKRRRFKLADIDGNQKLDVRGVPDASRSRQSFHLPRCPPGPCGKQNHQRSQCLVRRGFSARSNRMLRYREIAHANFAGSPTGIVALRLRQAASDRARARMCDAICRKRSRATFALDGSNVVSRSRRSSLGDLANACTWSGTSCIARTSQNFLCEVGAKVF